MSGEVTCAELIRFLDDYFEGRQPPGTKADFERHLAACRHCADFLRSYEITTKLCEALGSGRAAGEADAGGHDDVIRAILAARQNPPGPPS